MAYGSRAERRRRSRFFAALLVGLLVSPAACGNSGGTAANDGGGQAPDASPGKTHDAGTTTRPDAGRMDARTNRDAAQSETDASADTSPPADGNEGDRGAPTCGGSGWTLVWSDEFDGADGTGIDATKWASLTGGSGWGNQEREYYTTSLVNAHESGGNLVITATTAGAAAETCWYGQCQYTSARMQTLGLFSQEYGRFEARIQVPRGQGLWPAFWMLGSNIDTVSWPTCGEVDIMENIGKEPGIVHGSMHGPGYSGGNDLTAAYTLPGGAAYADGFHLFAVEWEAGVVRFYVDETLYETETSAKIPAGTTWVFDQPFFLLLNVAVGGTWPGDPDGTTVFPQTMLVDYVRVCQ
jgi:beta-glucanase (GH16 family)